MMILLGGITAWGQETPDYSGYYYIANYTGTGDKAKGYDVSKPENNFYLCPARPADDADDNYNYDAIYYDGDTKQQPYLTTYKTGRVEAAMWKVEFAENISGVDYYYIRCCADNNKYLTHNTSKAEKNTRFTVHLQATAGTNKESLFCFETTDDESFNIRPQKVSSGNRHINPANGNKNYYYGKEGTNTKINGKEVNPGGMVGYWTAAGVDGYASRWYLERVQPTISYNSADHKIEITNIDEDVTIYYTDDGITDPTTGQTENTGTNPIVITDVNNSVSIKAIAARSGVLPSIISEIRVVPAAKITLANTTLIYNGSTQTIGVTSVEDGDTPIPPSEYKVDYSNNLNAGDEAVVLITNEEGGNYIVYGSKNYTINKKDLTVTAKPKTITYGEEPTNDGVTYSGFVGEETLAVLDGTLDYDYSYVQYGDAGNTYTITPKGLTSNNYDISFDAGTLTVNQKEVGLTWSETTSFAYDGTSHGLTATATNLVNDDEIGVTVTGAQTNAGNHTATASALTGDKAGNYKLPNENTHAFTITPVALTVTAKDHTITYGDAPAGNGVTYSGFIGTEDESLLGGSLDYDYSYVQYGDVGDTYTIMPKGLTSTNYDISFVAGTLTVNPKALSITADAKSKAYGDDDPTLTYTSEGLVGSDAITGELSREAGDAIGTYAILQNTVTASSNYIITYTGANFTITPKPLTITAKPKAITYGDVPANDGVTYSGFAPGEDENVLTGTLAYAYDYAQYDNTGDYNITPSGLAAENYDISFVAGTLTVNPKEVGITWGETTTFVYDANSHAPTATVTGLLNGDEVGVRLTGQQTNVGDDYTATVSGLTGDKADNYTIDATYTKNFSITPAPLTVTAKNHTISYGDVPGNNGVDYDGFAGEDNVAVLEGTLSYDYDYEQYDEVGDYTITPSGLTGDNYDISFVAGTLTVKKKTIGLKWTNTSFTYDREAHKPSATALGMVNDEVIAVTVTPHNAINAGSYTATASGLTGEHVGHYELPANNTYVFTIAPKSLGDGDLPAEGITISLTSDGELDYVKDGDIMLTTDDYTYEIHNEGSDQIVAVTGQGNYTGSLRGIYAQPHFYDTGGSGERKNVAVYMSSRDVNNFEDVYAYTVKSVNTFLGVVTVNKLDYIPKGVPVLLLSASASGETGYVVEEKNESIADISESAVNSNLLKMAPEGGVPVETAQVYIFYEGEFVLTKAGTITEGKFYLHNPNYTETPADPGASPARGTLLIVEEDPTGMGDAMHFMNNEQLLNNHWYDLQGRKIENHKLSKGLYIHNGRKVIVK